MVKEDGKCWGTLLNEVARQAHQEGGLWDTDPKEVKGKPCGYLEEKIFQGEQPMQRP